MKGMKVKTCAYIVKDTQLHEFRDNLTVLLRLMDVQI